MAFDPTNKNRTYKVVIVAGEASGDLHGANLMKELRKIEPGLSLRGVGGDRLREAGVELMADVSRMGVVGITEVLFRIPLILKTFFKLKEIFQKDKPDLLILIDYSGFNLPLARAAKKKGIKILYFISPQVWASRKGRIRTIRETVDRMAVIIPFEAALYKKEGVNADFIGHPLVDNVRVQYTRPEAMRHFNLDEAGPIVSILPGSRPGEVKRLLPLMLETALILKRSYPAAQFLLPLASTLNPEDVLEMVKGVALNVRIIREETYEALGISDVAMVASGTATLETALLEIPMIIVYKVSGLTYQIGKRFVYIDRIGLVNIIAGKSVVPEFIQGEARPKEMARALADLLADQKARETMIGELKKVRAALGDPGASGRAARIAAEMLQSTIK